MKPIIIDSPVNIKQVDITVPWMHIFVVNTRRVMTYFNLLSISYYEKN